jgi:hypothetical protein
MKQELTVQHKQRQHGAKAAGFQQRLVIAATQITAEPDDRAGQRRRWNDKDQRGAWTPPAANACPVAAEPSGAKEPQKRTNTRGKLAKTLAPSKCLSDNEQILGYRPMLSGADLLAKVKEMGDASKSDIVRACGYVSTKKNDGDRLNFTAFYEALLMAKGVDFGANPKVGKGGRKLSFTTKVQFNGNLMVGKAYTALLDLKPGDDFEIKLGRKQIRLIPLGSDDEGE